MLLISIDINNRITDTLSMLNELNKRYYNAKKSLSFKLVFAELKKDFNPAIFNDYFEAACKNPKEKLEPGTHGRYHAALQALSRFNPKIHFYELDEALFMDVKKHLQVTENLKASRVRGYFNAYAQVMYWARLDHYISKEHQESVLSEISIKVGEPVPDSLSEEEILQWKHADCTGKYKTQIFIRYLGNTPVISKMSGHKKGETLSAYYNVNIREVAEATKGIDFKEMLGI